MAAVCAMLDPIMPAAPMMTSLSCVTKFIVSYLVCIEIVSLLRYAPNNKEERLGGKLCDPVGLTAHTPISPLSYRSTGLRLSAYAS